MGKTTGTVTTSLRYNPLGRLYELVDPTSGTTRFLYDGDALAGDYNASGTQLARYGDGALAGADDPLVSYAGPAITTAAARFLYADPRGSIVLAASSSGAATATNTYDEYGIPGSGNTGRFQYSGQAWLSELGMYYYKARMYSPTLGRFMQTDPIGYADNMNLYAYVGNDPVNGVDPSGLAGSQCSAFEVRTKQCGSRVFDNQEVTGCVGVGETGPVSCATHYFGEFDYILAQIGRRSLPQKSPARAILCGFAEGAEEAGNLAVDVGTTVAIVGAPFGAGEFGLALDEFGSVTAGGAEFVQDVVGGQDIINGGKKLVASVALARVGRRLAGGHGVGSFLPETWRGYIDLATDKYTEVLAGQAIEVDESGQCDSVTF